MGLLATFVGVVVAVVAAVIGWIPTELLTLLVPAVLGAGVATPQGSASAGFALADELSRLGAFRVVLAVFGCLVTLTALLTAGPVGYLAATVVTGLVSTVVLTAGACRWLRAAYGPPVADPMATPPGLVPFLGEDLGNRIGLGGLGERRLTARRTSRRARAGDVPEGGHLDGPLLRELRQPGGGTALSATGPCRSTWAPYRRDRQRPALPAR